MPFAKIRWAAIALLIALAVACGLWGGGDNRFDVMLVRAGIALRHDHPLATALGLVLNVVGGAPATIGLAAGTILMIWVAGKRREAFSLAAILFGGRLLVEVIKLFVRRARPAFDAHPVTTHSLSFPSAHAANSMIVFGVLMLLIVGARHRVPAVTAAIVASLVVGASRPLLGVHWPSDVIAGWAIGAAWLLLWWPALRSAAHEAEHDVVRGHAATRIKP